MSVALSMLSPATEGGGATFVVVTTPDAAVVWGLTGAGTLTPSGTKTNKAGVATAYWDGTGAHEGDAITVTVSVYA